MAANPFHDLYLSEAIGAGRFVELFSPAFVKHSVSLFDAGNVILRGLQGSGKTMLLNLLKPEIRIAYARAKREFPVTNARFISAGINLRKSGVMDFGQLVDKGSTDRDIQELALQFGDFVNYWLVADLLQTIQAFVATGDAELLAAVGLDHRKKLDDAVVSIAEDAAWFGYLDGVKTLAELTSKLNLRILTYRKLINLNLTALPDDIASSKTVIGNPLLKVADALRVHGVTTEKTDVILRIDQYEQLPTLNVEGSKFGEACQNLIHKALAARDSRVSYRIGTRHYAWPETPKIYGTNDALEHKRDYVQIDIDEKLRRPENRATWIFPDLAADIFSRRLRDSDIGRGAPRPNLKKFFGSGLTPDEQAARYVKNPESLSSALQIDDTLAETWRQHFEAIAADSVVSAKLGLAWYRQKPKALQSPHPPPTDVRPWEAKEYWRKERIDQALLQIASASKQQPIWAGYDDVIGLSGGNILVFLSLCQHIWDVWVRGNRGQSLRQDVTPIDPVMQMQGIVEASEEWLRKQTEGKEAVRRRTFVRELGTLFYGELTGDRAMSYPGHSGFSLNVEELEKAPAIWSFLRLCVDYGDLYQAPHTSKKKGEKRTKFYLAPVLTPAFKISYKHTKEPKYVHVEDVEGWMTAGQKVAASGRQIDMFGSP
jgi:hypothetical protein